MLSTLPVLSRPATSADRLPSSLYVNGRLEPLVPGQVDIRFVRLARVADTITFYLLPASRLGRPPLSSVAASRCYRLTVAALQAELPAIPQARRAATVRYGDAEFALGRYNLETSSVHEGLFLFTVRADGSGGADGGQSPATIQQTGMLGGGGGGERSAPPIVMDGVVPAGVATVTLQFPAIHHGSRRLPALNVTGDVVNSVFVIRVPTLLQRGGWPTTAIWRSASGKLIKTVNEVPFHP